jgi:hypothetical protein
MAGGHRGGSSAAAGSGLSQTTGKRSRSADNTAEGELRSQSLEAIQRAKFRGAPAASEESDVPEVHSCHF